MAATNPLFDQVSAGTTEAFVKDLVARTLFTATPALRVFRTNKSIYRPWEGGAYMKVPFDLQPVPAGAYSPGTDTFGLQQIQTMDDMAFSPKFYDAEMTWTMPVTEVFNKGPYQIVNFLKELYGNGSNSLDSQVAADLYNHGQNVTGSNRIKSLNGMAEALDDGYTASWQGSVFTTYGQQLRNGPLTGTTLNSVPFWGGNSDGSAAPVSNQILNRIYHRCKQGKGEGKLIGGKPDYGFCSDFLFGSIADRVFPMQRVDASIKDPKIGLEGLKFNGGIIFPDSFVPGTQNALYVQDASVLTRITTGTFAVPSTSDTNRAFSNMPTSTTTVTVGETFWWFRSDVWRFSYPRTGAYSFKNAGAQRAFDGDIMADIIRAAIVMYCLVPSSNQQAYGFNG